MRSWTPLVISKSCGAMTSRPFHLAEARPVMAMSSDHPVDEVAEPSHIISVNVDAGNRAEEPREHWDTRRMGHASPPARVTAMVAVQPEQPDRSGRWKCCRPVHSRRPTPPGAVTVTVICGALAFPLP
jgi:hypothetical protein